MLETNMDIINTWCSVAADKCVAMELTPMTRAQVDVYYRYVELFNKLLLRRLKLLDKPKHSILRNFMTFK